MQMGHVQDILLLAAALCRLKLQQSSTVKNCKEKLLKVLLVLYQFQDAKQSYEMYSKLMAKMGFTSNFGKFNIFNVDLSFHNVLSYSKYHFWVFIAEMQTICSDKFKRANLSLK